jgi:hypothetical protein
MKDNPVRGHQDTPKCKPSTITTRLLKTARCSISSGDEVDESEVKVVGKVEMEVWV